GAGETGAPVPTGIGGNSMLTGKPMSVGMVICSTAGWTADPAPAATIGGSWSAGAATDAAASPLAPRPLLGPRPLPPGPLTPGRKMTPSSSKLPVSSRAAILQP